MRRLNRVEKPSIKSSTFTDMCHTGQIHGHLNIQVRGVMATRLVSSQRRNQFEIITSQKNEKRERVHPWLLLRFDGNENAQPKRRGLVFDFLEQLEK